MKAISPRITLHSNASSTFEFLLNGTPLAPLQLLDVFEELAYRHKNLWAFLREGTSVFIYNVPNTFKLTIEGNTLLSPEANPARVLDWLPPYVHRYLHNLNDNACVTVIDGDKSEIKTLEFLLRA